MTSTTTLLLDGKLAAEHLLAELKQQIMALPEGSPKPGLACVLVGEHPASQLYVGRKVKKCQELGIHSELVTLPESISQVDLLAQITRLNQDSTIDGILVQLPLPSQIDTQTVIDHIDPSKDVDGFHPLTLGQLMIGIEAAALPCTPAGVIQMLDHYNIPIAGKHAVVVGRSNIVGKPVATMLLHRNATVTIAHSRTRNLAEVVQLGDIVIAAAGQPALITAEMIKSGAVVVDVGTHKLESGKIVGDVAFDDVKAVASAISPVPGGVGPMTIAMLMVNTVRLYQARQGVALKPLLFR